MGITLEKQYLKGYVAKKDFKQIFPKIKKAHDALEKKAGLGSEFTGWADLPSRTEDNFLNSLVALGEEVRSYSDCLISIGIGGSYLGIRATLKFLRNAEKIPVEYAGHNMSTDGLYELLESVKNKRIAVAVISKSGTTTEPAIAFRIIRKMMEEKYKGDELKKRIICITDGKKGALRQIADKGGLRSFVIPDDVGGRFSVLTPVGLVPLAIAGCDVRALVEGAREGQKEYSVPDIEKNIAYQYAAVRYLLYKQRKYIEVLASFYDNMFYLAEWWKQLYGESEAKEGKGIFPSSLNMSTDLHSMGQLMQDGVRNVFETFVNIEHTNHSLSIPREEEDLDQFNIVAGKDLDYVNKQALNATAAAHYEGGVPNSSILLERADSFHLGKLFYFFERAVAVSGYLLGVNPFNQPGVEAYKKKMFALLGKK
ncbi:MAG: glucose-6-phosphate isomerase [Candidatus Omnitrophica bacterium]|nr:glucose-6-phosphate isomerase [Candidatus Omnitrophota bacterium]